MPVSYFGVRHHGPGSARSLLRALDAQSPDMLLVEGPADAQDVLPLAGHAEMRPPVAILMHAPDIRGRGLFFPLTEFSPEWQAIRWAAHRSVPVRFMDLPAAHTLAAETAAEPAPSDQDAAAPGAHQRADPIGWLAEAAGEPDAERWWERMVEERADPADIFAAINEAMTAVRELVPDANDHDLQREAYMRRTLARAREEVASVAVVCGAWHVPALANASSATDDDALLAELPSVRVNATWIPWTYDRIAAESGYGAGVRSPAWYEHLWREPDRPAMHWMAHAAACLRRADLDASPAEVVDAVRLAEALGALRGRRIAGLYEVVDAALAVLCHGEAAPLQLIRRDLVVGEAMGALPPDAPAVPLMADIEAQAARLRVPMVTTRPLDLDLRKDSHREAAEFLHRVHLLGVAWGEVQEAARAKGSFHELWRLAWRPELALPVVEASVWGVNVEDAAQARALARAGEVGSVGEAAKLLDAVLLAGLVGAAPAALAALDARAALTTDTGQLMDAIPGLARVSRHGDVRGTDVELVRHIVKRFTARICGSLTVACRGLDDVAAAEMDQRIVTVDVALATTADNLRHDWHTALRAVAESAGSHPRCAGRCVRILAAARRLDGEALAAALHRATSRPVSPADAAAWIEGFLSGGGMILLYEPALWDLVDSWIVGMSPDEFTTVLPLLRRTVSTFAAGEVRQLAETVERGSSSLREGGELTDDALSAAIAPALPTLRALLGTDCDA